MHIPIILAHGVVGPLDELLPPILLGGILGMIAITWWNGRKANMHAVPPPPPELPVLPINPAPINPAPDAEPMLIERQPVDESHFPVN